MRREKKNEEVNKQISFSNCYELMHQVTNRYLNLYDKRRQNSKSVCGVCNLDSCDLMITQVHNYFFGHYWSHW